MKSLLEAIVGELTPRVKTLPSGARSLAHLRIVVPTAQSGRRLRQALASRFGALVPPDVVTKESLRLDTDDSSLANRTDTIAAFRTALFGTTDHPLVMARELTDLRKLLEPKALTFAAVAETLRIEYPEEAERWRELTAIEEKYLAELRRRGKRDRIAAIRVADASQWEETIDYSEPAQLAERYASLIVPTPYLIKRERICPAATPTDEATGIAELFAAVKPDEALPALCIADPELFPEIESAFKAKGLTIHNPAESRLVTSSLGHLVRQLVSLKLTSDYGVFSAFIRSGDARRWLKDELNLTDEQLTAAMIDLDARQAELLPEKIDDIAPKTQGAVRSIFEFVKVQLRKKSLRGILGSIFKNLTLDEHDATSREFAAAAEIISQLLEECNDERGELDTELFELRLEESTYSLEPDEGDVILTDGWMELPFLDAEELVIAGFNEGCVPESTVGHPYLPDSLRHRLGLEDNAYKERRDNAILQLAAGTRETDKTTIFFHAINPKGDALKPSRLLFKTTDNDDLIERVRTFYKIKAGTEEGAASDLPKKWKLALPIPPEHATISQLSPTRLDSYLRCPFTHYLKEKDVIGPKRLDDHAEELASYEYGSLAHDALEQFGLSTLKDSTDAAEIADFLAEQVDNKLVERFGTAIPAIVALQGESVKRRLNHFAEIQAQRRAEGWRIVCVERKLEIRYGHTAVRGKCDRIDYNDNTGKWCVIDYKTWDSAANAKSFETKRDGSRAWKSVQLALYCAMADIGQDPEFAAAKLEQIEACYCVLGKTKDNVVFSEPMSGGYIPEAETLVRELISRLEAGLFWPPAASADWKFEFEDWLSPRPEDTVNEEWIADQLMRIANYGKSPAERKDDDDVR